MSTLMREKRKGEAFSPELDLYPAFWRPCSKGTNWYCKWNYHLSLQTLFFKAGFCCPWDQSRKPAPTCSQSWRNKAGYLLFLPIQHQNESPGLHHEIKHISKISYIQVEIGSVTRSKRTVSSFHQESEHDVLGKDTFRRNFVFQATDLLFFHN